MDLVAAANAVCDTGFLDGAAGSEDGVRLSSPTTDQATAIHLKWLLACWFATCFSHEHSSFFAIFIRCCVVVYTRIVL